MGPRAPFRNPSRRRPPPPTGFETKSDGRKIVSKLPAGDGRPVYRLLGVENLAAFTQRQLEQLVRGGLLSPETKVFQDGEGFATAIRSRAEFQHLFTDGHRRTRR